MSESPVYDIHNTQPPAYVLVPAELGRGSVSWVGSPQICLRIAALPAQSPNWFEMVNRAPNLHSHDPRAESRHPIYQLYGSAPPLITLNFSFLMCEMGTRPNDETLLRGGL